MTVERAAAAGLWSTIDIGLRFGLQFIVTIVLARLLMPADFGVVVLLSFFASFAATFVQGGLSTALVQRREITHEEESAVFWWNLLAGVIAAEPVEIRYLPPRIADVRSNILNVDLIRREMGWTPKTDWAAGLTMTHAWLRSLSGRRRVANR